VNATKERQAWCRLQVKLCDPCLSTLCVPWCKKALYKYSSFPFLFPPTGRSPLAPTFGPFLLCQMAGWIKMPRGMEVNRGPGDVVLDGVAAPPPKSGTAPQFSVHVYCGQMAEWMKTPLGTEAGLVCDVFLLGCCAIML